VPKTRLMDVAWQGVVVQDANLAVEISLIRRELARIESMGRCDKPSFPTLQPAFSGRTTKASHAGPDGPDLQIHPHRRPAAYGERSGCSCACPSSATSGLVRTTAQTRAGAALRRPARGGRGHTITRLRTDLHSNWHGRSRSVSDFTRALPAACFVSPAAGANAVGAP